MSLYIANTTKKIFELHYWIAGNKAPFVTKIRPGGQENVYPQGSSDDHKHIIEQHRIYGLKPVNEVDRSKEFVGQCYQFDKPISVERLMSTFERNDEWLKNESLRRREEAAMATDALLTSAAQQSDTVIQNFEVDLIEQPQKGVETQVSEKIVVENSARRGRSRQN